MGNVEQYTKKIRDAIYGNEVRGSIADAIDKMDEVVIKHDTDMSTAITNANTATTNAKSATTAANTAANKADIATANAQEAAQAVFDEKYILTATDTFERSATVKPTARGNVLIEKVEGSSYQRQLSGKNLAMDSGFDGGTEKWNWVVGKNYEYVDEGIDGGKCLKVVGQEGVSQIANSYMIPVSVGEKVTLSFYYKLDSFAYGPTNGLIFYAPFTRENGNYVHQGLSLDAPKPIQGTCGWTRYVASTVVPDVEGLTHIKLQPYFRDFTGTVWIDNIQFEKGTLEATEYEPYCGGIPSPNPDYPQEIESVGDSGNLVVKAVGKNLLKINAKSTTLKGVKITINADGSITLSGTATEWYFLNLNYVDRNTSALPSGKYVLSGGTNKTMIKAYVNGASVAMDTGGGAEFIVPDDCIFNYVRLEIKGGVEYNETIYPMIRLAIIDDDTYEPYEESAITIPLAEPLRSIGDVKDEICMQDGKWGVLRRITHAVIKYQNGYSDASITYKAYQKTIDANDLPMPLVRDGNISRSFETQLSPYALAGNPNIGTNIMGIPRSSGLFVIFGAKTGSTIYFRVSEDVYTLLQQQDITIDYVVETPIFEPFSDQTPFYSLSAGKEVTNIAFVGESDNVAPTATIRFPRHEDGALAMTAFCDGKKNEIKLEELTTAVLALNQS